MTVDSVTPEILIMIVIALALMGYGGYGIGKRALFVPLGRAPDYGFTLHGFVAVGIGSLWVFAGGFLLLGALQKMKFSTTHLLDYVIPAGVMAICGFYVVLGSVALWFLLSQRNAR